MGEPRLAQEEIVQFLSLIYGNESGFSYIATKTPIKADKKIQDIRWNQHFFHWPLERDQIAEFIMSSTPNLEVYYSPALYSDRQALKENVQGAKVFWCEFDGSLPTDLGELPEPSLKVVSSIDNHEHWYWRSDRVLSAEELEDVNRKLAYRLGADTSGWDASQVLRPLGTVNHKRGKEVYLKSANDAIVSVESFKSLPEPPPVIEAPMPESIPAIEDVIPQYRFKEEVWELFKNGMPEGKRSDGLMALGYYLAEMQLDNSQMFAMLLNADERWGKFAGRRDQHKRLMEIVVRSRVKYPLSQSEGGELTSYGFMSLLALEEEVDWIWEGFLHRTGYMLVTGPSGVGKTQFSLNAIARMILGQDFLGRKSTTEPFKVGFFSLEMGTVELKAFLQTQSEAYTKEELAILEERFRVFPLGEPIYLTSDKEKQRVQDIIEKEKLNGVLFDSLGSVTEGSLSSEENVKNLMDWNDRLRQRMNVFTWYIHHMRKASGDNKKPNKLGDVYGSQYITARCSTALCLWDIGVKNTVQCIPLKTRFAEKPQPFNMFRDKHLTFHMKTAGITVVEEQESPNEVGETLPEGPEKMSPTKDGFGTGF